MSALARAMLAELSGDHEALAELAAALAPLLPAPEAKPEDRWMDSREAAAYLSLSKHALHRLTAARAVPCEQDCDGGKLWFKRSDLDAWRRSGGPAGAPAPLPRSSDPALRRRLQADPSL